MLNPKSIAVLPFVNLSKGDENDYFSDGITEEVINALGKIEGLKVIARTSSFAYKNKAIDVRVVGNELGVESILEGSIRQYKKRLRILVALVRTDNGLQVWSESFERNLEDIFALQDEISLCIADKIRENFGHLEIQESLIEAATENIEAYRLYLEARYHHLKWNSEGIRKSVELYEKCIEQEPNFALPYFGLGYSYAMYGSWGNDRDLLTLSANYIERGFALESNSHLGYFAKATLHFWGYWDFPKGEAFFKKALELNPTYTEAEEGLAELYTANGLLEEARHHIDHILSISPLSANHYFTKANTYYLQKDFVNAEKCLQVSRQINPEFTHSLALLQLCYIHLGDYQKLDSLLLSTAKTENAQACRALYRLLNPSENIEEMQLAPADNAPTEPEVNLLPWQLFLWANSGGISQALTLLEEQVEKRQGQIINFSSLPLLQALHEQPRFQTLISRTFQPENLAKSSNEGIFALKKNKSILLSDPESNELLRALEEGMKEEKWYRNASLSLRELADKLYIHPNKLSWLINEKTGKNFNEYINGYRLQEFKKQALNPKNAHLTLLGLAYESGFNSKSVFNTFFKKETGLTPKSWLKQNI